MEKRYDIIAALDINLDIIINAENTDLQFGQKEKMIAGYNFEMGGSSCIFASQAARLGLKAAGIGVAGDDLPGSLMVDKLKASGVITGHLRIDSSIKTGVSVILCKNGDRAILTYPGTNDGVFPQDFTDDLLKNSRHMHIGSYYLMKRLKPHYGNIVRKAKSFGLTISMDTNWDPDEKWNGEIWEVLPYVDIFMPNENEAMAIAGKDNIQDAVEKFEGIVPVLVVKRGKEGAAAYSGGREYFCRSLDVDVVDTIGAGDSFDAGFVYGFLSGYDIEKCLNIGSICGSMNTTKAGGTAGQVCKEKLAKMIKERD